MPLTTVHDETQEIIAELRQYTYREAFAISMAVIDALPLLARESFLLTLRAFKNSSNLAEQLETHLGEEPEVEEGRIAAREGKEWGACPYPNNQNKRQAWAYGWYTEKFGGVVTQDA